MPEGDTIHKLAAAMAPDLVGRRLVEARVRPHGAVPALLGAEVEAVEARGKHLLVRVAGGRVLRTHLGMTGSWHRYAHGEPWKRAASLAVMVLATERDVFVCFDAPQAELLRDADLARHPALARLGPDLAAPDPDLDAVLARARAPHHAPRPVGVALLDQSIACGLGNVYKSELCFLHRLDPWRPLRTVPDATLRAVYALGHTLLRDNLGRGRRVTTHHAPEGVPPRHGHPATWVYRRTARPCLACTHPIRSAPLGDHARATYWCPACQGAGAG